ncbi:MAG: c-type cytochrome [Alphaproteobacteria bacterium]|nr:c-type cytochrome [Alphaproteobacteria bacterium]
MDSFEWNKIFGALLGSILVVLVIREAGNILYHAPELEEDAFKIAVAEASAEGAAEAPQAVDLGTMLAGADPARGERVAAQCISCHSFEKGGPDKQGPHLWGVVGRAVGGVEGFTYSAALKNHGGTWTLELLSEYLKDPRGSIPGNNMAFGGLKRDNQRADVLAYLNSLSDSPAPLPAPAASDPAETVPAGESAAPAGAETTP